MTIKEYRETRFSPGSRPDPRTVRRWIDSGALYGEKIGGTYYVEPDRKIVRAANELVLRVLNGQSATQR